MDFKPWMIIFLMAAKPALGSQAQNKAASPHSFSMSLGLTQLQGAQLDPLTQISVTTGYSWKKLLQFSFNQSLSKNYFIEEDGSEFAVHDSLISLSWTPQLASQQLSWYGSISTTLPVSERSQRNDLYTVSTINTGGSYRLGKLVSLGAGIGASYYFTEYDSEPGGELGSGAALPLLSAFARQSLTLHFAKNSYFAYSFEFTDTSYHKIKEQSPNSDDRNINDQSYQLTIYFAHNFGLINAQLGYIQGTILELPGLTDYVLFDEEKTIAFASLGLSF